MPFENFFGNHTAVALLESMAERGRIPQTILVSGPEGVGKATLARRFAASLLGHAAQIETDDLSRPHNAELLAARPVDKLRTALRILRLAETYTPARLEAACGRGLAFGDVRYVTLKHILAQRLEDVALTPLPLPAVEPLQFARPPAELTETILGDARWN